MNEGFGKDFHRKGDSVKRSGPFSEPPDSENLFFAVPSPSPQNQLLTDTQTRQTDASLNRVLKENQQCAY